jgi:alpha-galactosidase
LAEKLDLTFYAHDNGFKMGIYSGPGDTTCAGFTGSLGHEAEDAEIFASWGIHHLKYDSCCAYEYAPVLEIQQVVLKMSEALLATGRPIVYHACHCGWADIWEWAADEGANQWRIGQDR